MVFQIYFVVLDIEALIEVIVAKVSVVSYCDLL